MAQQNRRLTERQKLFVKIYLANGRNADAAAKECGYAPTTIGQNIITYSPAVSQAIEQGRKSKNG